MNNHEASYKNIGSYTIEERNGLFAGHYRAYHKQGQVIAIWTATMQALKLVHRYEQPNPQVEISRAQAFRYWRKHFDKQSVYSLPKLLQEAVEKPCKSFGTYVRKDGNLVGYEG